VDAPAASHPVAVSGLHHATNTAVTPQLATTMRAEPLPGGNEYVAWETQPSSDAQQAASARAKRAEDLAERVGGGYVGQGRGSSFTPTGWSGASVGAGAAAPDASFAGDTADLIEQLLMEQMGKVANVMQATYYSEKFAVECAIPDEAGGNLSVMQDASLEQKGHGEAGGIVWKCAATMAYHLCDRTYFPAGYWR
jgi:hypothetical protein